MFKKNLILTLLICLAHSPLFAITEAEHDNDNVEDSLHLNAIYAMTNILLNINGSPSPEEDEKLRDIINADTTTKTERSLAQSLLFMDTQVREQDKKELLKLKNNQTHPTHIQKLANILYRLYNQPSAEDKKKLMDLLD